MAPVFESIWRRQTTCNPLMSADGCGDNNEVTTSTTISNAMPTVSSTFTASGSFTPGVSTMTASPIPGMGGQQSSSSANQFSSTSLDPHATETLPFFAIVIIVAAGLIVAVTLGVFLFKAKKPRHGVSARDRLSYEETQKMREFRMEFNRSPNHSEHSRPSEDVSPPAAAHMRADSRGSRDVNSPLPPPPAYSAKNGNGNGHVPPRNGTAATSF